MNIRLYIIYYTMPGHTQKVHLFVCERVMKLTFREMKNRIIIITIIIYPRNNIFMMNERASERER